MTLSRILIRITRETQQTKGTEINGYLRAARIATFETQYRDLMEIMTRNTQRRVKNGEPCAGCCEQANTANILVHASRKSQSPFSSDLLHAAA